MVFWPLVVHRASFSGPVAVEQKGYPRWEGDVHLVSLQDTAGT